MLKFTVNFPFFFFKYSIICESKLLFLLSDNKIHYVCSKSLDFIDCETLRNTSKPVAAQPRSFINTNNYYPVEDLRIVLEGQAQSLPSLGTRLASTAQLIRQSWAAFRHHY